MALPATLRRFDIALSDADRGMYVQLDWRVAQHPSESERYLIARVLARALEHGERVEWSDGGVSDDEEPAIIERDLRGDIVAWIEIGSPSPERLHKASKRSPRVVVYTWKSIAQLGEACADIFGADRLELVELPVTLLDRIAATLDRVNRWELAVSGGTIYLTIAGSLFEAEITAKTPQTQRR